MCSAVVVCVCRVQVLTYVVDNAKLPEKKQQHPQQQQATNGQGGEEGGGEEEEESEESSEEEEDEEAVWDDVMKVLQMLEKEQVRASTDRPARSGGVAGGGGLAGASTRGLGDMKWRWRR